MKKIIVVFILLFASKETIAQSESSALDILFKGLPLSEEYDILIKYVRESDNFIISKSSQSLIKGKNGFDYFVGRVVDLGEGYNVKNDMNSFSIIKSTNYSVNSIVFKDTLELVSITVSFKDKSRFESNYKKLKKITKISTGITKHLNNKIRTDNNIKYQDLYFTKDDDKLPLLSIDKQAKGYGDSLWFNLNVIYYKRLK